MYLMVGLEDLATWVGRRAVEMVLARLSPHRDSIVALVFNERYALF